MATLNTVRKFGFWAHKILPLVYDESLSYYEFLCKVMAKLNEVIDAIDSQNEVIASYDSKIEEGFRDIWAELAKWESEHATTVQITQDAGDSISLVMSQNAVTSALNEMADMIDAIRFVKYDGEVTSARITAGYFTADLNDILSYGNKIVYLGTDFTTRADVAHMPVLSTGVLTTVSPCADTEWTSAMPCVATQTFETVILTVPTTYTRVLSWDGNDLTWSDWQACPDGR